MGNRLAVDLRPNKFSQLVGQEVLVRSIRKQYASERKPSAWMFHGPTGTGKTTVARILALSLQCAHQEKFGEPCDACIKSRHDFSINEVNASEISGVEQIGNLAGQSTFLPIPPSRKRIYILDEAQRLSSASQNLLLKYFEDAPATTVWMICTTEPNKILETLQRRCELTKMSLLGVDGIGALVRRTITLAKSTLDPEALIESLCQSRIQSPGLILNVVENYVSKGMSAEDSVKQLGQGVDATVICQALLRGDWDTVRKIMSQADADDMRGMRAQMGGYLRRVLEKSIASEKGKAVAQAIERLSRVDTYDVNQAPATVSAVYEICSLFRARVL